MKWSPSNLHSFSWRIYFFELNYLSGSQPPVPTLVEHYSQGWAMSKPGSRSFSQVSHLGGRVPNTWAVLCLPRPAVWNIWDAHAGCCYYRQWLYLPHCSAGPKTSILQMLLQLCSDIFMSSCCAVGGLGMWRVWYSEPCGVFCPSCQLLALQCHLSCWVI